MTAQRQIDYEALPDLELAALVGTRDPKAVRLLTARNNQRLFRAAWSILRNRAEAEDAVQSTYLRAFAAIRDFAGRSSLSTWLTRIAINEALMRDRSRRRREARFEDGSVVVLEEYRERLMRGSSTDLPEDSIGRAQIRQALEAAIARLPFDFRTVFVLREIEDLGVEEVASLLDIPPATVKTRHYRARRRLQQDLEPEFKSALAGSFPFAGADCAALTERVLAALCGSGAP